MSEQLFEPKDLAFVRARLGRVGKTMGEENVIERLIFTLECAWNEKQKLQDAYDRLRGEWAERVVNEVKLLAEECKIVDEESPVHQLTTAQRQTLKAVNEALEAYDRGVRDEGRSTRDITVFMDKIDWEHEVGEANSGTLVFPSVESLTEAHPCCETECGIVEVEMRFVKVIKDATLLDKNGES